MVSRCCGSRLSLRNQYDTKTPRASLLFAAAGGRLLGLFAARPDTRSGFPRVTHPIHSVGFEILGKFLKSHEKKNSRKIPSELPTAGLRPPNLRQSLCQRNTGAAPAASRPQVQVPFRHYVVRSSDPPQSSCLCSAPEL